MEQLLQPLLHWIKVKNKERALEVMDEVGREIRGSGWLVQCWIGLRQAIENENWWWAERFYWMAKAEMERGEQECGWGD
jgi:hypothetical protein